MVTRYQCVVHPFLWCFAGLLWVFPNQTQGLRIAAGPDDPVSEPTYIGADIADLVLRQWRNANPEQRQDFCEGDRFLIWDGHELQNNRELVQRWQNAAGGSVSQVVVERTFSDAAIHRKEQLTISFRHPRPSELFADIRVGGRKAYRQPEEIFPDWESQRWPIQELMNRQLGEKGMPALEQLDQAFQRHLSVMTDHYRSDHAGYLLRRPFATEAWARDQVVSLTTHGTVSEWVAAAWQLADPQRRPVPDIETLVALPTTASFAECIAVLEKRVDQVNRAYEQIFSELSPSDRKELLDWTANFRPLWRGQSEWPAHLAGFQVSKKLDIARLAKAVTLSGKLLESIVPGGEIHQQLLATRHEAKPGPLSPEVAISSESSESLTISSPIHIDLGGDDLVTLEGDKTLGHCRVFLDLGGNDIYVDRGGKLASACGSASFLIDAEGDDQYLTSANAAGFAILGLGVLWDQAGNDLYRGEQFCQGVGCLGIGLLIDRHGNDRYDAASYGQGVGLPNGFGAIIDRLGDDNYLCTGRDESPYGDAGEYAGWGQGIGFGFRHAAAGGVGAILDLAGRDQYRVGQFGLGCGYYYGIGLVYDGGGDDRYECSRYGLATAAHYAVGVVIDDAGDDEYDATRPAAVASLGGVWDLGVGMFVDSAGNDHYRGDVYFLGAAAQTGYGMFWDKQGQDFYQSKTQQGTPAAGYWGGASYGGGRLAGNLALFWDQGNGDDTYQIPNRRNSSQGVELEYSIWCDE